MKLKNTISLALLATTLSAFSWGQKGHDTTAAIAQRHLTPTAAHAIDSILDGKSILYYANWLDNASHTPEYAYSKTWHYKNIDKDVAYEKAPKSKTGDVVTAVMAQIDSLTCTNTSKQGKALALKILTHCVGDMHQPMHVGRYSDRGGNYHNVLYFNNKSNLHKIWDSSIVESGHKWSYTEWVDQVDRLTDAQARKIVAGTPDAWCKETWTITQDVYNATPEDTNVEYTYIADWTPVIEIQFVRGGHRLAHLLNTIFDPAYKANF